MRESVALSSEIVKVCWQSMKVIRLLCHPCKNYELGGIRVNKNPDILMTARALNPAFRILLPERKPVSNVQQFLVAERESLFGPAVNLDVITLICTYLPSDICCFCQRIHETGRFDCHGCKQESVFCTDTPRMKVKDIKSAACTIPASDVSQFMYNSEGFVCDGCAEDYCFRCIQRGGYGPHKCSVCGDKFIDCCNQDGVCFACSEYELSGGGVVNGHAWFPEAE